MTAKSVHLVLESHHPDSCVAATLVLSGGSYILEQVPVPSEFISTARLQLIRGSNPANFARLVFPAPDL